MGDKSMPCQLGTGWNRLVRIVITSGVHTFIAKGSLSLSGFGESLQSDAIVYKHVDTDVYKPILTFLIYKYYSSSARKDCPAWLASLLLWLPLISDTFPFCYKPVKFYPSYAHTLPVPNVWNTPQQRGSVELIKELVFIPVFWVSLSDHCVPWMVSFV